MSAENYHPVTVNKPCSAQEAVDIASAGLAGTTAFVFMSSRSRFEIGTLEERRIMVMRGDETGVFKPVAFADFDEAYELRIFGKSGDWHWRRDGLSGNLAIRMPSDGDRMEQKYLLWGKAQPSVKFGSAEWTLIRDPRVKPFWAPVATKDGTSLYLHAVEHVGRGVDGNAYVAFERLTGIQAGSDADDQ